MFGFRHATVLLILAALCCTVIVGCADRAEAPEEEQVASTEPSADPFAAYAGDWMSDIYVPDSDEPAMAVLIKATGTATGWTTKYAHVEEPVPSSNVFLNGDTVVVSSETPFPSGLREGRTVESVTTYLHLDGDTMSGRFVATYDDGESGSGRIEAQRIQ